MKLFSLLFLCASTLHAANANLAALGQPKIGSFYLSDSLNSFSNPGGIKDSHESLIFQSDKFAAYKSDSFQVGIGREYLGYDLIEAGMLFGEIGVEAFTNLKDEKVNVFGGTVGVADENLGFKVTVASVDDNLFFSSSVTVPMSNDFTAYVKYMNTEDVADDSAWTFALAKTMTFKSVSTFADLTYDLLSGTDSLVLTAGVYTNVDLFGKMNLLKASINKGIYFNDSMKVNLGDTLKFGEVLALDLSTSLDVLDKVNPVYSDFDVQVALTFYL